MTLIESINYLLEGAIFMMYDEYRQETIPHVHAQSSSVLSL